MTRDKLLKSLLEKRRLDRVQGVTFISSKSMYCARAPINGVVATLGLFECRETAAREIEAQRE